MADLNAKLDATIVDDAVGRKRIPRVSWADILARVGGGTLIELGVYHGESFRMICDLAFPRKVYGFDWFYGLSEDWGFPGNKGSASRDGVPPDCPPNGEFVIGLVEHTLRDFVPAHPPAAFVHFDLDVYTPTRIALETLRFAPGCILAFDEIDRDFRNFNAEQRAFREWLRDGGRDFEMIGRRHDESWVLQLS